MKDVYANKLKSTNQIVTLLFLDISLIKTQKIHIEINILQLSATKLNFKSSKQEDEISLNILISVSYF